MFKSQNTENLLEVSVKSISQNIRALVHLEMETFTQKSIQRQKDCIELRGKSWVILLPRQHSPSEKLSFHGVEGQCKRSNKPTHSFTCSWTVLQKQLGPRCNDTSICDLEFCLCPAKNAANVSHLPSGLACKSSFQLIWLKLWVWLFLMPLMLASFGEIRASQAEYITGSSRISLIQWTGLCSPLHPCTPPQLLWGGSCSKVCDQRW